MVEPPTPQGGEGASRITPATGALRRGQQADQPAHRVADQDRRRGPGRATAGDRGGVVGHRQARRGARAAPARVAGQVGRQHRVAGGAERRGEARRTPSRRKSRRGSSGSVLGHARSDLGRRGRRGKRLTIGGADLSTSGRNASITWR